MEVRTVAGFLSYYEGVREGTNRILRVIPPDRMDWSYMPGKFTIADIIRHIAAIERYLFAQKLLDDTVTYKGCGKELADGYENVLAYFNRMHEESMKIFGSLSDEDLTRKITTMNGKETEKGKFLRALIIHESHHRGALSIYLNMLHISVPPVFGVTSEQIIQISK